MLVTSKFIADVFPLFLTCVYYHVHLHYFSNCHLCQSYLADQYLSTLVLLLFFRLVCIYLLLTIQIAKLIRFPSSGQQLETKNQILWLALGKLSIMHFYVSLILNCILSYFSFTVSFIPISSLQSCVLLIFVSYLSSTFKWNHSGDKFTILGEKYINVSIKPLVKCLDFLRIFFLVIWKSPFWNTIFLYFITLPGK